MISRRLVEEIISVYIKHGWKLGRVLLSGAAREKIGPDLLEKLFVESDIVASDFDAAWFERPSKNGATAIELRHLGEAPFALFELVENDERIEEIRNEMENRLASHASKPPSERDQ